MKRGKTTIFFQKPYHIEFLLSVLVMAWYFLYASLHRAQDSRPSPRALSPVFSLADLIRAGVNLLYRRSKKNLPFLSPTPLRRPAALYRIFFIRRSESEPRRPGILQISHRVLLLSHPTSSHGTLRLLPRRRELHPWLAARPSLMSSSPARSFLHRTAPQLLPGTHGRAPQLPARHHPVLPPVEQRATVDAAAKTTVQPPSTGPSTARFPWPRRRSSSSPDSARPGALPHPLPKLSLLVLRALEFLFFSTVRLCSPSCGAPTESLPVPSSDRASSPCAARSPCVHGGFPLLAAASAPCARTQPARHGRRAPRTLLPGARPRPRRRLSASAHS
jgi:hypothetical protein